MKVFKSLNHNPDLSLALGFFDGVHLAHQKLISHAVDFAKENSKKSAVITFETNPSNQRIYDQEVMNKYGVKIEAWAPFGEGKNNMFNNEVLISIGQKYDKTSAQVILRWLIQRGVIVVCKSTHFDRIKENFNVFDFSLSDEDMKKIKTLNTNTSLFFNHQDPNMVEWFDNIVKVRRENNDFSKEKKNW